MKQGPHAAVYNSQRLATAKRVQYHRVGVEIYETAVAVVSGAKAAIGRQSRQITNERAKKSRPIRVCALKGNWEAERAEMLLYKGCWNNRLRFQLKRMLCSSSSSNDPTPGIIQFSASAVVAAAAAAAAADGVGSYGRLIGNDSGNVIRLPLASYLHHQSPHHHDHFALQAGASYTPPENFVQDQSIHSSYPSTGLIHHQQQQQQQQEHSVPEAINVTRNNNYSWDPSHQTHIVNELPHHHLAVDRTLKTPTATANTPPASSNQQR